MTLSYPARLALALALPIALLATFSPAAEGRIELKWSQLAELPPPPGSQRHLGVAGPFAGISNDALIVAGGANFPVPFWDSDKTWHDDIYVLVKDGSSETGYRWITGNRLPRPIAYGSSATTSQGVLCIGGNDAERVYDDVLLLTWDPQEKAIRQRPLPALPTPCTFSTAAVIGDVVYVAGGTTGLELETAQRNFWALDLSKLDGVEDLQWQLLPPWPGPARALAVSAAQNNGVEDCIYVMSGRRVLEGGAASDPQGVEFLTDVYEFAPSRAARNRPARDTAGDAAPAEPWRRRRDLPRCVMVAPGIGLGQSHVLVLGGDDGSLFHQADVLRDDHPGFPRAARAYHTITDTWTSAGTMPASHVTTPAVRWGTDAAAAPLIIPSGEVRPRVRSPQIWQVRPISTTGQFGLIDFSTICVYLASLVGVGIFFSFRNKTSDDFFRGGQRVPWFVAGLSIFATMLSSITFVAIPAKAYATDWGYFLVNMTAIAVTPVVIIVFLPFFRRIDATSAYEYLEMRFNRLARMFASASFVLFQIGRMAVVMYLPALALAVITPLSEEECILLMGVLSVIYCTLGGLEAVVWTDAIQTFVLLGGAFFSLMLIISQIDGGASAFFEVASEHDKFHIVNWDFGSASFATTALWVVVLGGIGQSLVPYTSDMAVVQRYMSVADIDRAKKSLWTNAIAILPASLLFFGVGTGLFVFYSRHPEKLDPTFKTDAIFPLFISRELPTGIAGLVVAGIFAAAQSTISTSMNSIATAVVTDFVRPLQRSSAQRNYLGLGRLLTALAGVIGTLLALGFAASDIMSLWDQFMRVLGLFGGSMCGLFCLGIFTTRANGPGAIIGALAGAAGLYFVQQYTDVHLLLYASVGIVLCVAAGYVASWFVKAAPKSLEGLTIHTL